MDLTYTAQTKAPAKKGEVDAEWLKKEKLTVLATKEDLKAQERNTNEQGVKMASGKVGLDIDEADFDKVGFGKKPVVRETGKAEEHNRKGKKPKPHFTADDFPSL